MTRLSGRRFPHLITRIRQQPGDFNDHGEFVPGEEVRVNFKVSIQPLSLSDDELSEGTRIMNRIKIYVPNQLDTAVSPLLAAAVMANSDKVEYNGDTFVIEESWFWGDHVRATALLQPGA